MRIPFPSPALLSHDSKAPERISSLDMRRFLRIRRHQRNRRQQERLNRKYRQIERNKCSAKRARAAHTAGSAPSAFIISMTESEILRHLHPNHPLSRPNPDIDFSLAPRASPVKEWRTPNSRSPRGSAPSSAYHSWSTVFHTQHRHGTGYTPMRKIPVRDTAELALTSPPLMYGVFV